MRFVTPTGRFKDVKINKYLVDWEGDQGSLFSEEVLDFLHPYWEHDVVVAELPVAGTRMRYDYINLTRRIVVETDGKQHDQLSQHFHGGSQMVWLKQMKNDLLKDEMAAANGFKMIRIKPDDLPLTKSFFKTKFDIDL